jgi:hypothetical protein
MGGAFLCRSEALLRLLVMVTRVLHTIIRDDPRCPYGDSVSARKRRDGAEWLSEPSKQVEDRVFRMKADVAPINSMAYIDKSQDKDRKIECCAPFMNSPIEW